MKPYEPAVPRPILALAAAALSSITLALLVLAPSRIDPESRMLFELARADAVSSLRCGEASERGVCSDTSLAGDGPLAQSRAGTPPPRCDRSG